MNKNYFELTATEASLEIQSRNLTSESLVISCLERIAKREGLVRAWAWIDPDYALEQARAMDKIKPLSKIHGIPIGIKDVIDTYDMPTEYGSPIYKGNRPKIDAACVSLIREKGGVILGKTVSTEFATRKPNVTRNPHNILYTPGGSSSGSAAAVADFMVPIALGTQTAASIIRPSSFCGVYGYKPTFGLINRSGLKFLSESLDTIGIISRSVSDIALLTDSITGTNYSFDRISNASITRVGLYRTQWWDELDKDYQVRINDILNLISNSGIDVVDISLPDEFKLMYEAHKTISSYEFYRALTFERTHYKNLISDSLSDRLFQGEKITRQQYDHAKNLADQCRDFLGKEILNYNFIITPSVFGVPPKIISTGEPNFGVLWSLMQMPCINVPIGLGSKNLPLGIQVVSAINKDSDLLMYTLWMEKLIANKLEFKC